MLQPCSWYSVLSACIAKSGFYLFIIFYTSHVFRAFHKASVLTGILFTRKFQLAVVKALLPALRTEEA